MQLHNYVIEPAIVKSGDVSGVAVLPGQHFKAETAPAGEELFDFTCPQGKNWVARIIVEITETDA